MMRGCRFGVGFEQAQEFLGDGWWRDDHRQGKAEFLDPLTIDSLEHSYGDCRARSREPPERKAKTLRNADPDRGDKIEWTGSVTSTQMSCSQNKQSCGKKGSPDQGKVAEEILHLILAATMHEDLFNKDLECETDD